jgi:hypothetical protein
MGGKARGNFNDLVKPIVADPVRAERVAARYAEAVEEHRVYDEQQAVGDSVE